MLMLTHRVGESISIGDIMTVTVTAMNGNRVRLGIEAPAEVKVLREELRDMAQGTLPKAVLPCIKCGL